MRRARVVEALESGHVWVVVPSMTGDAPVGPLPVALLPLSRALRPGDEVLVQALEGGRADLVVVGVLAEGPEPSAVPAEPPPPDPWSGPALPQ